MPTISVEEAKGLIRKWVMFSRFRWQKIIDLAKSKIVPLPVSKKEIGGTIVSLSERGVEFTWMNQYIDLEKLVSEPAFKLKDLSDIRTFVEEVIDNGDHAIETAVVEREQAFQEVFEPFRGAAAEWGLEENKRAQKQRY
jgi:hypothetical protein